MKFCSYLFLLTGTFLACQAQFKTIKIGEQVWMAENLNVVTFRNGDTIPEAKTQQEWDHACFNEQPAWCYYDNDPKNGLQHGKLYNWYAFIDSRGLAPAGFSIPSDLEWRVLADFLSEGSGPSDKMRSKTGWLYNGNGRNSSGFNAFPSGCRSNGSFNDLGTTCYWWSFLKEGDYTNILFRSLKDWDSSLYRYSTSSLNGLSVRCIREN